MPDWHDQFIAQKSVGNWSRRRFVGGVITGAVLGHALVADAQIELERKIVTNFLSFAAFNPRRDATIDQYALLQRAIIEAAAGGYSGLFIPPGNYGIERSSPPLYVPAKFTLAGVPGRSWLKALGSVFQRPTKFPVVGLAMVAVANVGLTAGLAYGERYLKEIGRVGGVGATFNVIMDRGVIISATVANGGANYKTGDVVYLANSTSLIITSTSLGATIGRGSIVTVIVRSGGSGWGEPHNPVTAISSNGRQLFDRILDPATLGEPVSFINLGFDGDWGGDAAASKAVLSAEQRYSGLYINGVDRAVVDGCNFRNFPNDACALADCRRGIVVNNFAYNNGWTGFPGSARNAFSNAGIYVTENGMQLNTDSWLISNNQVRCTGDVAIEYHWITGEITNNTISDYGTIGLEGQGSAYQTAYETRKNNGGVPIPSSLLVKGNHIDGARTVSANWNAVTPPNAGISGRRRSDLPFGIDGWTHAAGNEGHIVSEKNVICNTLRRGIAIVQNTGGLVSVIDNEISYIGRGSDLVTINKSTLNEIGAHQVEFLRNRLLGYNEISPNIASVYNNLNDSIILYLSNGFMRQSDICNNIFKNMKAGDIVKVAGNLNKVAKDTWFNFNQNKIDNCYGARIMFWAQGVSSGHLETLSICDNIIANWTDASSTDRLGYFDFISSGSGTLDLDLIKCNRNAMNLTINGSFRSVKTTFNFAAASSKAYGDTSFIGNRLSSSIQFDFAIKPAVLRAN